MAGKMGSENMIYGSANKVNEIKSKIRYRNGNNSFSCKIDFRLSTYRWIHWRGILSILRHHIRWKSGAVSVCVTRRQRRVDEWLGADVASRRLLLLLLLRLSG